MRKSTFQISIGFLWFFAQIGTIAHTFLLQRAGGFEFEDFTTTAAIIGPIFLGFTSAFVKLVIDSNKLQGGRSDVRVSGLFAMFTTIVVALFVTVLNWLVHDKAYSKAMSFEQFKLSLAALQTFLGVYVGVVLGALFGVDPPSESTTTRRGK